MGLAPGLRATVRLVVTDTDTAAQIGSGDVSVLATPRLLALAEAAAVAAITPGLEPGLTSVGTAVSMEHKRASAVGAEVIVEAELTEVEGRRLVFSFIAWQNPRSQHETGAPAGAGDAGSSGGEESAVVGAGTVERVIVDRERFVAGARRGA
jgi:fluoroacetyl-CoA thioesterase